jgi:hypothetical protein
VRERIWLLAAALAGGGCNALEWDFGSAPSLPEASTPPLADTSAPSPPDASVPRDGASADAEPERGDAIFFNTSATWAFCLEGGCPLPSLHCDVSSGQCFPCLMDMQCQNQNNSLTQCDHNATDALKNVCVECSKDSECNSSETCIAHQCVTQCPNHPCPKLSASKCDTLRGICVGCSTSADCAPGEACNTTTGRCGECARNSDCPSFTPLCDTLNNSCVGCLTSADCEGGDVCEPQSQSCVHPPM